MQKKLIIFALGLAVGMVVVFFILENSPSPADHSETNISKTKEPESTVRDTVVVVKTDTIVKEIFIERPQKQSADSIPAEMDSINVSEDSAGIGTYDELELEPNEDIAIVKEELLFSTVVQVQSEQLRIDSTDSSIDSILARQSGIQIQSRKNELVVEFWEHPFYRIGYLKNGKVLRIYGVPPSPNIQLKETPNGLYLGLSETFYSIDNTFNLLPLNPVQDSVKLMYLKEN